MVLNKHLYLYLYKSFLKAFEDVIKNKNRLLYFSDINNSQKTIDAIRLNFLGACSFCYEMGFLELPKNENFINFSEDLFEEVYNKFFNCEENEKIQEL